MTVLVAYAPASEGREALSEGIKEAHLRKSDLLIVNIHLPGAGGPLRQALTGAHWLPDFLSGPRAAVPALHRNR